MKKKATIPKALREQVWIKSCGKLFETKCTISWCKNKITVFDFECGHNIPESKGGLTVLDNLIAICGRCNKSMSNQYTIDDWNKLGGNKDKKEIKKCKWLCCFSTQSD